MELIEKISIDEFDGKRFQVRFIPKLIDCLTF